MADTIALDDAGGPRVSEVVRVTASIYGPDTTYRSTGTLGYGITNGNRIEIGSFSPCPANAICTANDKGRIVQGGTQPGDAKPHRRGIRSLEWRAEGECPTHRVDAVRG